MRPPASSSTTTSSTTFRVQFLWIHSVLWSNLKSSRVISETYVQLEHFSDYQLQDVPPGGRYVGGQPQEVVYVAFLKGGGRWWGGQTSKLCLKTTTSCWTCSQHTRVGYFTRVLEDFWTKGKFSCRMGIRKRLVLKAEEMFPLTVSHIFIRKYWRE